MSNYSLENVLLVYKKSLYQIYFVEKSKEHPGDCFTADDIAAFKVAHETHQQTLAAVEQTLKDEKIRYRKVYRARQVSYGPYDFVISVGGDGTLIEAARCIGSQPILGVNSDPDRSHGHFCCADRFDFPAVLRAIRDGTARTGNFARIAIKLDGDPLDVTVMNELLFSHEHPAAMTKYDISCEGQTERQRGSGVWVSTPIGSTGAIASAGGKIMRPLSRRIQYLPRELFEPRGRIYDLRGGQIPGPITLTSRMREGMVYLDGCHYRLPLGFGHQLEVSRAAEPLRLIRSIPDGEDICRRAGL